MRRAFSSCLLYSWMRLIWQSKIVFGSTTFPEVDLSQSANCAFAALLDLRNTSRKLLSAAKGFRLLSWLRSVIQRSPMTWEMMLASAGLAWSHQRTRVTPGGL